MQQLKGGSRKVPIKRPAVKKATSRVVRFKETVDILPAMITVRDKNIPGVPGHVWRQAPFKWDPMTFAVESERLNERIVESSEQDQSLSMFLKDPKRALVYGVSGNPHDSKAKLFAAYLVSAHVKVRGTGANILWHTLYDGYNNDILREYEGIAAKSPPTMLVLTNVPASSTGARLGKIRDLLERFCDIPRVVVIAGEDPLSFFTTKLHYKLNALAYFSESLVKKRMEIL